MQEYKKLGVNTPEIIKITLNAVFGDIVTIGLYESVIIRIRDLADS
jgi:hypothetical protein